MYTFTSIYKYVHTCLYTHIECPPAVSLVSICATPVFSKSISL